MQWAEENVHDLPFGKDTAIGETSTGGILKLMQIMEEYEAVFVSGVMPHCATASSNTVWTRARRAISFRTPAM